MMDPISIIVTALVLGATANLKSTAAGAVKDAYARLKIGIRQKYPPLDVSLLESDPTSALQQNAIKEELQEMEAGQDEELLQLAQALLKAIADYAPETAAAGNIKLHDIIAAATLYLTGIEASDDVEQAGESDEPVDLDSIAKQYTPPSPLPFKREEREMVGAPSPLEGYELTGLRLDTALPGQVEWQRSFELAVAICQPDSPPLREADLDQNRSGDLQVAWPDDAPSIALRVHVSAPECTISRESHAFRLFKGQDSPVFYFQLTPQQTGRVGIVVTVYQEEEWLGGTRLQTMAQEQVVGQVETAVYSHPIGPKQEARLAVAQAVEQYFDAAELRMLCYDLAVNFDNLRGEIHAERVRALVEYMVRHGRFHDLIRTCQHNRTSINWEALAGIAPAGGEVERF
jgi:hypothetical protein